MFNDDFLSLVSKKINFNDNYSDYILKETVNKDIIRKVIDKDACTDEIKNDMITSNECN